MMCPHLQQESSLGAAPRGTEDGGPPPAKPFSVRDAIASRAVPPGPVARWLALQSEKEPAAAEGNNSGGAQAAADGDASASCPFHKQASAADAAPAMPAIGADGVAGAAGASAPSRCPRHSFDNLSARELFRRAANMAERGALADSEYLERVQASRAPVVASSLSSPVDSGTFSECPIGKSWLRKGDAPPGAQSAHNFEVTIEDAIETAVVGRYIENRRPVSRTTEGLYQRAGLFNDEGSHRRRWSY